MQNYFELLDIIKAYDIDLKILEKQYFAKQLKYHPDKARDSLSKQESLTVSAELNKAYNVLSNNLKRAEYILSLEGINLNDEEARTKLSVSELSLFWDTLEIIEYNDKLVDLEKMNENYKQKQRDEYNNLSSAFQKNNLSEAELSVIKLKYLETLISNLQEKIALCK